MTIRRVLIFAPLILILFLLQSYFWVPTYEQQTRGNPDRLKEYITASIADAALLNPILLSDVASGEIEGLVFDRLVDLDEELRFRGRLATSWELYEEAYFYVNALSSVPGLGKAGAQKIADFINEAKKKDIPSNPRLKACLDTIQKIEIIPTGLLSTTQREKDPKKNKKAIDVKVLIKTPPRIKLTLSEVNQDLFENLSILLGENYFSSFRGETHVTTEPQVEKEKRAKIAKEFLPATEHNPIIIFHLRPNVRFHDGHIFDAKDVTFTYDAIMNPKNLSPRTADYEPVKRVEVIDPLTVRVVYKRLYSPAMTTWSIGILPEHRLNDEALKDEAIHLGKNPATFSLRKSHFNRHPIGCGPFAFHEWRSDQYIALNRFDDYWEGAPNYERYFFRIIPDWLTQEMEFYAGSIDSYGGGNPPTGIPPHQVERLGSDTRYQRFSGTRLGYTYIGYNIRRKPFDDPRVRRALGMAIDIDKIIKYVLHSQGERITGPFVKQTDFYNHGIQPLPYDPEGALDLLKEAGWIRNKGGWLEKNGKRLEFTLITNSGNDIRKAILAIAQDAWKQIGIDVRTDLLEWSVFIQERVDKADFDALILGWSMGIDPDLYQIWHSSQTNPYQLNFVGFKNTEADDLIVKIRQEYHHNRKVGFCHRFHEIIAAEQPYTFLYVHKWTAILDKRIVIKEVDREGNPVYKKIKSAKIGEYYFNFNKWAKLQSVPRFAP